MAVNKNFVVKNGLEVDTNLIVADANTNRVGIGTSVPQYTLHVFEGTGIGATNIFVTGIITAATAVVGSAVTINSSGINATGIITATEFGITGSTNTLNASGLNVGVATATTLKVGTAVTISVGIVAATEFDILGSVNTFNTSGINISGVVTATSFSGSASGLTGVPAGQLTGVLPALDGSQLIGVVATGSGIFIQEEGSSVGTATTINFVGLGVTATVSGGTATIAISGGSGSIAGIDTTGTSTFNNLNVTGVSTFAGITTVTGPTLFTKQLNVSGVVTATTFIGAVTGNVTGNATGLSGTPNITVGTIGATSLNVSGVVTASSFNGYQTLVGTGSSATKTFTVTVANKTENHRYFGSGSSQGYFIDGVESPFITLLPGKTYRFDQSDGTNGSHPLRFYLEADKTTQYTTNVTTNGTAGIAGAYTEITIVDTTPIVLHYQCVNHGYMGNAVSNYSNFIDTPYQITARSGVSVTGVVTAGVTTVTNLTAQQLNVSGITTLGNVKISTGIITAVSGIVSFYGDGSGLTGAGSTVSDDTTTNQEFFPLFTSTTSGTITASKISTSKLTYNPSTGTLTAVDLNATSDVNLKENIHTVENALDVVNSLRGVSFDWKETGKGSYGVIAQELEKVLPELVKQVDVKSVNYNGIIGVLIEAVKELSKEIEEIKKNN